jgi:hypothetical protein
MGLVAGLSQLLPFDYQIFFEAQIAEQLHVDTQEFVLTKP